MVKAFLRALAWSGRTLVVGSRSAQLWTIVVLVAIVAFGGAVLGPVTMQTATLVLVLFVLGCIVRLLVGGGRR